MKYHEIGKVHFEGEKLFLMIDGEEHVFTLSQISEKLAHATEIEREKYQVSPSGYGIHWPLIDEDLSIDGLLGISHSPTQKKQATGLEVGFRHYDNGR
jgi:hypothetical protein